MSLADNQTFNQKDFAHEPLNFTEFEDCSFEGCNFSTVDLGHCSFISCTFIDCEFSMTLLGRTAFQDVHFEGCKLLGLYFNDCNPLLLSLNFTNCHVKVCSFEGLRLPKTIFLNCDLSEADFNGVGLKESSFEGTRLERCLFDGADLEGADFRQAIDFALDPEIVNLKGARFSKCNLEGLLKRYDLDIE